MMRIVSVLTAALALALWTRPAEAQAVLTAPVTDNFDLAPSGGFELSGWVVDPATTSGAVWKVDALPAGPVGAGPDGPTFGGSIASLNFNDDTGYTDLDTGSATSPAINITALGGSVILSFACNYQTETSTYLFDTRDFDVLGDSDVLLGNLRLSSGGEVELLCAPQGTYHVHVVDLVSFFPAVASQTTIKIRYNFAADFSVDGFAGWFVDNFTVTCADAIAPTTPVLISPADASTVVSPPGVMLDWADSTDTTSCGAGTVLGYVVEVDTTNPPVAPFTFSAFVATSTATTPALPAGDYFWRVRAFDATGNVSADSGVFKFTAEPPLPPLAPDTLFVNESVNGAQSGRPGFVDPVVDEQPHFSAIFRDANTADNAIAYRFQVSFDPTFTLVDFDSGSTGISPVLPKDSRIFDLTINVNLLRDTIYFWRIQFTDVAGATGPFSASQSFRVGDDFEFGVRTGSTHHGRKKCYVATAAFGGVTPEVQGLMSYRGEVLERAGAGQVFSRAYHTMGATVAGVVPAAAVRTVLSPIPGTATPVIALVACSLLALLAAGRFLAK